MDEKLRNENALNVMQQLLSTLTMNEDATEASVVEDTNSASTGIEEKQEVQPVEAAAAAESSSSAPPPPKFDKAKIKELRDMGFEVPLIKIALSKKNHVVQDAMMWLFSPEAMDFVEDE